MDLGSFLPHSPTKLMAVRLEERTECTLEFKNWAPQAPCTGLTSPEKGGQHHAFSPLFRTFPQLPGDDQPKFEKLRKLCRAAATGRLGGDPCSDFCWVSIP